MTGFATVFTFISLYIRLEYKTLSSDERCSHICYFCKGSLEREYADVNQDLSQHYTFYGLHYIQSFLINTNILVIIASLQWSIIAYFYLYH
jgi:hypothetical protein